MKITFLPQNLSAVKLRANKIKSGAKVFFKKASIGSFIGTVAVLWLGWGALGIGQFKKAGDLWQGWIVLLAGILVGFVVIFTPRERYRVMFAEHFGWAPVTIGALSYWYWKWYTGSTPASSDFFNTAAQVLPVLLLAAVVDVRRSTILKSSQLALPVLAVFLGEMSALSESGFYSTNVKYAGVTTDFAVVSASLVTAVVALLMALLADLSEES